jgi:hypothetical protein
MGAADLQAQRLRSIGRRVVILRFCRVIAIHRQSGVLTLDLLCGPPLNELGSMSCFQKAINDPN